MAARCSPAQPHLFDRPGALPKSFDARSGPAAHQMTHGHLHRWSSAHEDARRHRIGTGLEFPFIEVHDRAVVSTDAVGKTEAFVQPSSSYVRLVHTNIHGVGTALAGNL